MTRFETTSGESLGFEFFAGKEFGKMFFLTTEEGLRLFALDSDELLGGETFGWTAGELVEKLKTANLASSEFVKSKFGESMGLFTTFNGLDENGDLRTGFRR